ncbi:MAG: dihydroneopterin aldolase [Alphaproteobacteria bacterium]
MSNETLPRVRVLPTLIPDDGPLRHLLVRDLVLPVRIGVRRRERGKAQRVAINLDMAVLDRPVTRDRLSEVTDYEAVVEGVRSIAAEQTFNLVETLAETIATLCLTQPDVRVVRVRVEKLDVFAEAGGVGVEIERRRLAKKPSAQ